MTKTEAIEILQPFRDAMVDQHGCPISDAVYALDVAIETLKQSEQMWIPVTKRVPEDLEEVNVTWVNHDPEPYYDFVKDKPCSGSAVYYKGSWYWDSSTCVDILAEYGRNESDKIDDGIEVVAWMPLPEPWKGGEA